MTKCKAATLISVVVGALSLSAADDESVVATGDCATEAENLTRCSLAGQPCLDQAVSLVECSGGNGLVEVNVDSIGLVVASRLDSSEWRKRFPRSDWLWVSAAREGGPPSSYYRVGRCYRNPAGNDPDPSAEGNVVLSKIDDFRTDDRYHGFADPHCEGDVAIGTVVDPSYFSSAVNSYMDAGSTRPPVSSLPDRSRRPPQ